MAIVILNEIVNAAITPSIFTGVTGHLPPAGSVNRWVLDKTAGILYIDNGTALIAVITTSPGPAPVTSVFGRVGAVAAQAEDYAAFYATIAALANYLPLTGGTLTGPLITKDISATKTLPGANSAAVFTTGAPPNTADNLLNLIALNNSDGSLNNYIFRGQTPPNGTGANPIVIILGLGGTIAYISDLATYAPLVSPALTGVPTAPTAAAGTNTTQLATTAFVQAALPSVPVSSVFGRTGAVVALAGDYSTFYLALSGGTLSGALNVAYNFASLSGGQILSEPIFGNGCYRFYTPTGGAPNCYIWQIRANQNILAFGYQIANRGTETTTGFTTNLSFNDAGLITAVSIALSGKITGLTAGTAPGDAVNYGQLTTYAPLSSPAFIGIPVAPTAAPGNNTTQLATTAFVQSAQLSIIGTPTIVVTAALGVGATATVSSNGKNLSIVLFPGATGLAANSLIATITLANAMSYNIKPVFSEANINASLNQGSSSGIFMSSVTNNTIQIVSGTATFLTGTASLSYNIFI